MLLQKIYHSSALIEWFKVQQAREIWISYVHYILVPYFQRLVKYKLQKLYSKVFSINVC